MKFEQITTRLENTKSFREIYNKYSFALSKLINIRDNREPITNLLGAVYFNKWQLPGEEDIEMDKIQLLTECIHFLLYL